MDLTEHLRRFRKGNGDFTIADAADAIGQEQGLTSIGIVQLFHRMAASASSGDLQCRDALTGLHVLSGSAFSAAWMVGPTAVNEWLARSGADYRWQAAGAAVVEHAPVPRAVSQENAILDTLVKLGFNPTRLPPAPPGKPSVPKQDVRDALSFSDAVMNKAWQRLLSDGRIKYA